jgi:cytochrome c oxidase subunit 3
LSAESGLVAHHFEDIEQQRDANTLGMWVFLCSEILFFGGLFTAYTVMRLRQPGEFALASRQLNPYLGGLNTAILLASSFTMALAVWAAQTGSRQRLRLFLLLTLAFGGVFLAVKGYEWSQEAHEHLVPGEGFGKEANGEVTVKGRDGGPVSEARLPGVQLAMLFYFIITGLHALHMVVGLVVLLIQLVWSLRDGKFGTADYTPIEVSGLYWHFVDVVWIFVFPILYLLRG